LIKNISVTDNHLNNSFDLVQKLKDIQVDDNYILISLDIDVSLFTNIPIDLAIFWRFGREHVQQIATFR